MPGWPRTFHRITLNGTQCHRENNLCYFPRRQKKALKKEKEKASCCQKRKRL